MSITKKRAIPIAQVMCLVAIFCLAVLFISCQSGDTTSTVSAAGVFVLGGIHQAHEQAKFYTYERMGEVYKHLKPDVFAVECLPEFVDDRSFSGMPFDFKRTILPLAVAEEIPIYGIDWWDETRGTEWQTLQQEAWGDSALQSEVALFGGMFQLLNLYFCEQDFRDINADEITAIWSAKSELKYAILRRLPKYREIVNFEEERNGHIVNNVMNLLTQHPGKRVLVAVGIDHKYYIERALREQDIHVLSVEEVLQSWWK